MTGAPIVTWRIVLCDNAGQYISMLDGIAQDIEAQFTLNRAASLVFNVPSEHPYVNIKYNKDNLPYLSVGKRSVKAWRKIGTGAGGWELMFAGRVWSLEDNGDGDTVRTQVTCFDPLKLLEKRVVRTHKGEYWVACRWWRDADAVQSIPSTQLWHSGEGGGAKIIKNMIERSRKYAGLGPGDDLAAAGDEDAPVHIETGAYGIWPTEGWVATTPMTFQTEPGSYIMPYIVQICNTGTVDLVVTYRDAFDKGVFMHLGAKGRVGTDKTTTVSLNYAFPPYSASNFVRTQDLNDVGNFIALYGKKMNAQKGIAKDATSMTDYLVMEIVESLSDITNTRALQLLANMRKKLQSQPKDMVTIVPTPEGAPLARPNGTSDEYWLGDTISVKASDPADPFPITRQIVDGAQRVYSIKFTIDNDYGEYVSELIVSLQDAQAV